MSRVVTLSILAVLTLPSQLLGSISGVSVAVPNADQNAPYWVTYTSHVKLEVDTSNGPVGVQPFDKEWSDSHPMRKVRDNRPNGNRSQYLAVHGKSHWVSGHKYSDGPVTMTVKGTIETFVATATTGDVEFKSQWRKVDHDAIPF